MKNIFITSCGIRKNELKNEFYKSINKNVKDLKVLYITTASDGELIMTNHGWMLNLKQY